MSIKEYMKNNLIFIIAMFFYMLITLPSVLNHIPCFDEAHAYMQAYFMNFHNWVNIVKIEGHPPLWYLLIMPFAKAHWHYPYPMLIINYISCIAAIAVMWKAAPFNKWLKLGIMFSCMFLIYFPIIARGYALGVLLIFLLSALYKNKLEHPFLYPALVALTLNLNIICGIGASWFGLIFFIELLKSNLNIKTKTVSGLILIFSTLLFIFPFIGGFGSEATYEYNTVSIRLGNIVHFFTTPISRIILLFSSLILILIKTRLCKEQTLILYTYTLLLCIFAFFYPGGPHHFLFFFIYLLSFIWIYVDTFPQTKNIFFNITNVDILSVIIIFILFIPLKSDLKDNYYGHKIHAKDLANIINTNNNYRNSRFFLYEREALIIPYLKKDIEIFNACNRKPLSWDSFDTHNCIPLKDLKPFLQDKTKNTFYIITPNLNSTQFEKEFKIYEFPQKIDNKKGE